MRKFHERRVKLFPVNGGVGCTPVVEKRGKKGIDDGDGIETSVLRPIVGAYNRWDENATSTRPANKCTLRE